MNTQKFFIGRAIGFLVVAVLIAIYFIWRNESVAPTVAVEDIRGCYVSEIGKDVYTLKVTKQKGEQFEGTLQFKNFEKDSSSGTYSGTYTNEILSGEYAFQSEGLDSVITTQFKKEGTQFVRGIEQEEGGVLFDAEIPGSAFIQVNCEA